MKLIDFDKIEWYGCDYEGGTVCRLNNGDCKKCNNAECSYEQVKALPTIDAVVIPDGATNGDMIKAMFPNFHTDDLSYTIWVGYDQMSFKRDWWDAPYNPPKQNLAPADKSGLEYADQPTLQSAT